MDDGSCKGSAGSPNTDENLNPNPPPPAAAGEEDTAPAAAEGRRPFTSLSQEEADLALARVLQEQERAYMMLTGQGGSEYAMLDGDGYGYDDDEGDGGDEEEDVSDYEEEEEGEGLDEDQEAADAEVDLDLDDEAFARALQDAEERDVAGRLMALAGFGRTMEQDGDEEDDGEDGDPQDAWDDVDPDEYSYEELVALGEVVGTESKGLSADTIASLPAVTYQAQDRQDGNMEQCVICRVEFEEGESLVALPCKHPYHSECINHWLKLNKVCPMCSAEVSVPPL